MKIKVVNQRLYLEPPETAEGTREYLRAEFSFSEEWDGTVKTAFFRGADGENHPKLLKDDTCIVPAEALAVPGRVGVSVSGTLGDTVITTDIKSFSVPATLSGGTPSDPEPTVWQQILDKVDETQQIAQSVRDDADAGKFAATAEMVEQAVSVFMAGFSPEMHRNIFRGKSLGESITAEQLEDWRNVGYPESEKVQKPHILIVPDTILGSGQMNTGNSTSGGYRSSAMKSTKLNQIADALPDTFKDMLISHRMFSDGSWIATSVDLMNEVMVHGTYICADNNNKQTSDAQQLVLFRLAPELKAIGVNYWLRNAAGSQTYTLISQYGDASSDMATSTYGIRPVFAIG